MSKVFEFIGFNLWLLACTGIASGVFLLLSRVIRAQQFDESVEGFLLWAICIPAFVATWHFVGSRTLRLVQAYYDRSDPGKH